MIRETILMTVGTGDRLTGSTATYYTVAASESVVLKSIALCNTDTTSIGVTIYLVKSGSSASDDNIIYKSTGLVLAAGETKTLSRNDVLEAGDTIQASAGTTEKVAIRMSGYRIIGV
jgi:hypothetical protein